MLPLVCLAQLAMALAPDTSATYATPALDTLVRLSAEHNRAPPASLDRYTAHVESELAFLVRDTVGREHVTQVEQVASHAVWDRSGRYALRVVGFRAQSLGIPFSALSFVRTWTVPTLYGNHLQLGIEPVGSGDAVVARGAGGRADTLPIEHPFAAERATYYRFAGGDTVAILRLAHRTVPIVRITVDPAPARRMHRHAAVFQGEIDLDAQRHEVVRMRGQFLVLDARVRRSLWRRLESVAGLVAVAYVDFENVEVGERYWLPAYQRTEFQASLGAVGEERSVFRIVSRFSHYTLETDTCSKLAAGEAPAPAAVHRRPSVTFAPRDSLDRYEAWMMALGRETSAVSGADFREFEPNSWRATGPPLVTMFPRTLTEIARFNRVEGAYTGMAAQVHFRDVVPGLELRTFGGWAWTEATARGGAVIALRRGDWTYAVRAERSLASTNDFVPPLANDPGIAALLWSEDDNDYVDRRIATLAVSRTVPVADGSVFDLEVGGGRDLPDFARLRYGPFGGSESFRANRGALAGSYGRIAADLELNPDIDGDFLSPGVGARIHSEYGVGQLTWERSELSAAARATSGGLWLAAHGDAGIVFGEEPPPQQLFEVGGIEGLPGYSYKEFGGDRAALVRFATGYNLPLWNAPLRVFREYRVPGINPGFATGLEGGWASAGTKGTWRALALLGARAGAAGTVPVSLPTNGVRATADIRITFFSGAASLGIARPVDHPAPWGLVAFVGQAY